MGDFAAGDEIGIELGRGKGSRGVAGVCCL